MKKQISQREAERRLAELMRKGFKREIQLLLKPEKAAWICVAAASAFLGTLAAIWVWRFILSARG